jgi:DNA repair protein RadC
MPEELPLDEKYGYLREVEIKYKKRRTKSNLASQRIEEAQQIYELFRDLEKETKEKLICLSVDNQKKILCFEVVAIGSLNAIHLRPFEVIRGSLPLNPFGIYVVHNHPSGDPKPSSSDIRFVSALKTLTDAAGLKYLDNIIIGEEKYFSFANECLLE